MNTESRWERFHEKMLADPEVRAGYEAEVAHLSRVRAFMEALDEVRIGEGISKAELARRADARPDVVRRLFSNSETNPSLATVLRLVGELGYTVTLTEGTHTNTSEIVKDDLVLAH